MDFSRPELPFLTLQDQTLKSTKEIKLPMTNIHRDYNPTVNHRSVEEEPIMNEINPEL